MGYAEAEYVEEVMENGAVKVYLKGRSLGKVRGV
jgi:hypothetical protein